MKSNRMIKLAQGHCPTAIPASSTQACKTPIPGRSGIRPLGLALLLALMTIGSSAWAANRNWTAGANANWHNPAAWAEVAVPAAGDDVFLKLGSSMYITNGVAVANSVTLNPASSTQNLLIWNGTSGNLGSLVVGGGTGSLRRTNGSTTLPGVQVSLQSSTDLGTNGLLNVGSLEGLSTSLNNGFWHCFLTTTFNIFSYNQMLVGTGGGGLWNVFYHQAGGTVASPNYSLSGSCYGVTLGVVTSYGAAGGPGVTNTINYYLDAGKIQANRIGAGDANGQNTNSTAWLRWMPRSVNLYFNDGTIQPYNYTLFVQNLFACKNYTTNAWETKDMQFATWSPTTIVLATNGTHTFSTTNGGAINFNDIYITPSAQIVDSIKGPGSLVKDGSTGNLVFCGDNPYATNSYSGTTTVNGGAVQTRFDLMAGQVAADTGDNVLVDAFSTNSRVILNGGNYSLVGRANKAATSHTGTFSATGVAIVPAAAYTDVTPGMRIDNTNFPAGTYLRHLPSSVYWVVSHLARTNAATPKIFLGSQPISFAAASFICTQRLAGVTLQQNGALTVSPNGSSGTTLVCGPIDGTGNLTLNQQGTGNGNLMLTGNNSFNGSLKVDGNAKVQLTGVNTYSGATYINWGKLTLGANSWPSNTPSIYFFNSQNLDGSAIPGGIVVGPSQLIYGGYGPVISGNITINGTISPGTNALDIEPFGFSANVTLAGLTVMKLNKDLAPGRTNDTLNLGGELRYGGTLNVTNIGATPLVLGDSFQLFTAATYATSDFAVKNLPPLDSGLAWNWSPASGILSVVTGNPPPVANPDTVMRSPGLGLRIRVATLLANDTDDTTTNFVGVSATSTNFVNLTTDGTFIYYTNSPNVNDQFTYTISDGSLTATGVVSVIMNNLGGGQAVTVAVAGLTATVRFAGIPGLGYEVQRATNIVTPTWVAVLTTSAPPAGVFQVVDAFSDLGVPPLPPPGSAYYRLRWVP